MHWTANHRKPFERWWTSDIFPWKSTLGARKGAAQRPCCVCSLFRCDVHTRFVRKQNGFGQAGKSIKCCVVSRFSWCLPQHMTFADSVLFSGMHWAARNKPSTMSWLDVNVSCTCSSTPIGLHARMPLVARRGSASKTPLMEVEPLLAIYYCYCILLVICEP